MPVWNAIYREDMEKYIMKVLVQWDTRLLIDMVEDWEARLVASRKLRGSKKTTTFKMEFELLATLIRRSKYDNTVDNRCSRCRCLRSVHDMKSKDQGKVCMEDESGATHSNTNVNG